MRKVHYYTVVIPYTPVRATIWHPDVDYGPMSILTRGAFDTLAEARRWAYVNIPGHAYNIKAYSVESDDSEE